MADKLKGQCLCGDVRFTATGLIKRVSACYCGQCRKQNGGGPFYGAELQGELIIEATNALQWYGSSEKATRGFCCRCGSSLFWKANTDPSFFDVSLGALDDSERLKLDAHIFVDSCPAYLSIDASAPHLTEQEVLENPLKEC
ncbi:MAG: GFA family protein [Pseudomonadales bacterium]